MLLEVNGEPLIERQIHQLHEVGIHEIYVVVGFMKEQYEYLIDDYGILSSFISITSILFHKTYYFCDNSSIMLKSLFIHQIPRNPNSS